MHKTPTESRSSDPFAVKEVDELAELRALRRAVDLSLGFKLLFVAPKLPKLGYQLCETLLSEFGVKGVHVVRLEHPIHNLLDELEQLDIVETKRAVVVLGLELSMFLSVRLQQKRSTKRFQ